MYFCEKKMITAEIISIGNELLNGKTINTNSVFLSQLLDKNGVNVHAVHAIADSKDCIFEAFNFVNSQTNVVIFTGGLGPTNDDVTKSCICEYFNANLVHNETVFNNIVQIFSNRGYKLTDLNKQQALVPDKASFIQNTVGTAPGLVFFENSKLYLFLPGVPFEMKKMAEENLMKIIKSFFKIENQFFYKDFLFVGLGESYIYETILANSDFFDNDFDVAFLPSPGMVKLRIKLTRDNGFDPIQIFNSSAKLFELLFSANFIGDDDDNIALVIQKLFANKNLTLSVAESCTGGLISSLITSNSGASEWLIGGIVAYSNEVKIKQLNVDFEVIEKFGAVSEEVVIQMAENSRIIFGTDYSLSISGIAGPSGGSIVKPVGTIWIAVSTNNKTYTRLLNLGNNDRVANIQRAAMFALLFLLDVLKKEERN